MLWIRVLTACDYRYKVTKGLLDRFGEQRVIDTPITEAGFCGLAVGAALAGLQPVVSASRDSFRRVDTDAVWIPL
jgi:pyruvate/2-oxoglutarate/acetoin dehydrogenase E1 component